MKHFTASLLSLVALVTVAHGNGWCNQPAFQKYSISSPLLFSCDDSDLKTQISSLQQEIQQSSSTSQSINQQLLAEIQQLKQTCDNSALVAEISQLREEIRMLKDSIAGTSIAPPPSPIGSLLNPATNCSEISQQNDTATTGIYWLNSGEEVVNVTCDFDVQLPPPSPVRGWQEITNINMSIPTESCPSPLRETTSPFRRCEKSSDSAGCESIFFPTKRVPFTKLCGRAVGYSNATADAFESRFGICAFSGCDSINDPYLDGMSITYSSNNSRAHVWSLVVDQLHRFSRCPCGEMSGFSSPSFVANDYYCEVARDENSPLWEGEGCTDTYDNDAPCCENPNFPWFCREFDQPIVTDNIELRVCTDEDRINEEIQFDLLRMYIQ